MSTTTHVPLHPFFFLLSIFLLFHAYFLRAVIFLFVSLHTSPSLNLAPAFLPSLLLPSYTSLTLHGVISLLPLTSLSLTQVLRAWTERGNLKNLIALDLDLCDNLTEEALYKFLARYGSNLRGLVLSGIPQCTDSLCSNVMPALKNIR